jgi:hypothetical protein
VVWWLLHLLLRDCGCGVKLKPTEQEAWIRALWARKEKKLKTFYEETNAFSAGESEHRRYVYSPLSALCSRSSYTHTHTFTQPYNQQTYHHTNKQTHTHTHTHTSSQREQPLTSSLTLPHTQPCARSFFCCCRSKLWLLFSVFFWSAYMMGVYLLGEVVPYFYTYFLLTNLLLIAISVRPGLEVFTMSAWERFIRRNHLQQTQHSRR